MKKIIELMNELKQKGLISNYALFGAMAVAVYVEAIATEDFDMVVAMKNDGFIDMSPIYQHIKSMGYDMEGLHFIIDGIPLDIVVVKNDSNDILFEALQHSVSKNTDLGAIKVFTPDYLAAIALGVGRKKDYRKIDLLLDSGKITKKIAVILKKYKLSSKWEKYKRGVL
jgi:hypothetical protein